MRSKNFSLIMKGLKQFGAFFLSLFVCFIILSPFPQKSVDVDYNKYQQIEEQEKKAKEDFDILNKNFKTKEHELSENKQKLIVNKNDLNSKIENADKKIKELSEEVK